MTKQTQTAHPKHTAVCSAVIALLPLIMILIFWGCAKEDSPIETETDRLIDNVRTTANRTVMTDPIPPVTAAQPITAAAKQKPETKAEILAFYSTAVNKAVSGGAGYSEKHWGVLKTVDSGDVKADDIFRFFAELYLTPEDKASVTVRKKGQSDSNQGLPECSMNDVGNVKYATCKPSGNNYDITIVLFSDDTAENTDSFLEQMTNTVIYWDEVEAVLAKISMIRSINRDLTHVVYNDFTVRCIAAKDGTLISVNHSVTVDVETAAVVRLIKDYDVNFSAQFLAHDDYDDFVY